MPRVGSFLGERFDPGEVGHAEVHQLDAEFSITPLGHHHVVGFDVAVNDAFTVGFPRSQSDLGRDIKSLSQRARIGCDPLAQALAFDESHRDEQLAVVLVNLVDGADVGVIEGGDGASLVDEARLVLLVLQRVGPEEFQGDRTPQPGVLGLVNHTHAAFAQLFGDSVVGDDSADHRCLARVSILSLARL